MFFKALSIVAQDLTAATWSRSLTDARQSSPWIMEDRRSFKQQQGIRRRLREQTSFGLYEARRRPASDISRSKRPVSSKRILLKLPKKRCFVWRVVRVENTRRPMGGKQAA